MDAKKEISTVEELEFLLKVIISPNPNNTDIKKSTELVKLFRKKPECVESFLFILKNNQSNHLRQLSAILLNKKIESHWHKLDPTFKVNTRILLIDLITKEKDFLVAKAIANLIFKIAKVCLIDQEWNDLLDYIFIDPSKFNKEQTHLFELNLYIISELIETSYKQLKGKYGEINTIISLSLTQGTSKVSLDFFYIYNR